MSCEQVEYHQNARMKAGNRKKMNLCIEKCKLNENNFIHSFLTINAEHLQDV